MIFAKASGSHRRVEPYIREDVVITGGLRRTLGYIVFLYESCKSLLVQFMELV
jgi:hypothetical protein